MVMYYVIDDPLLQITFAAVYGACTFVAIAFYGTWLKATSVEAKEPISAIIGFILLCIGTLLIQTTALPLYYLFLQAGVIIFSFWFIHYKVK